MADLETIAKEGPCEDMPVARKIAGYITLGSGIGFACTAVGGGIYGMLTGDKEVLPALMQFTSGNLLLCYLSASFEGSYIDEGSDDL